MNSFNPWSFKIDRNLAGGCFDVMAGRVLHDGRVEVVQSVTVGTLPAGSAHPGARLHLTPEDAQNLLDELWRAGVRPTDQQDHGTTGHVKALEHHAEVMEAIATGLLRRDGVEI